MEYLCPYCNEWYDAQYCKGHFESAHGQENVTFERLRDRLQYLGGLDVREEAPTEDEEERVFLTNNFRHVL